MNDLESFYKRKLTPGEYVTLWISRLCHKLLLSMKRKDALWLSGLLGGFLLCLWRSRRKVALKNLRQCFPEKSENELRIIAHKSCVHVGMTVADHIWLHRTSNDEALEMLEFIGFEALSGAMKRGNGAIICSAHLGSWEFGGAGFHFLGYPTTFLVGKNRNPKINVLLNEARQECGLRIIELEEAYPRVIEVLKKNELICLQADWDFGKNGLFLPFLGRLASTPRGPALFAIRSGAAFIPGFMLRASPTKHIMYMTEAIYPNPGVAIKDEEQRIMTEYNHRLEQLIRKYPEQYFWIHDRFASSYNRPS